MCITGAQKESNGNCCLTAMMWTANRLDCQENAFSRCPFPPSPPSLSEGINLGLVDQMGAPVILLVQVLFAPRYDSVPACLLLSVVRSVALMLWRQSGLVSGEQSSLCH